MRDLPLIQIRVVRFGDAFIGCIVHVFRANVIAGLFTALFILSFQHTTYSMNATFRILNLQKEFLGQSQCQINGLAAKNVRNEFFVLDSLPSPPYTIDISCEGYLSVQYKSVPKLTQTFSLRRANEAFYYDGFFQVAALHDTGTILVLMTTTSKNGKAWSPAEAKIRLEEQATPAGLHIARSYYSIGTNYKDNLLNESKYDYLFILAPDTTQKAEDENHLLQTVRSFESVEFAGLAFYENLNYQNPIAYKGRVTVLFNTTVDSASSRRALVEAGYAHFQVQHAPDRDYYFIDLPEKKGANINTDIEKLMTLAGVADLNAELWKPLL